jgi:Vacuolar-sorting-associated 13 protein C-terminal
VGHVFESPQALFRVISTHYSSQLTKQVFGILGSLAIFGAPADFISNVGTSTTTMTDFLLVRFLMIGALSF